MSDVALPPVDPIVASLREAIFPDVTRNHQREEEAAKGLSRVYWWVGVTGTAIGVLGMVCATVAIVHFVPQVRYTVIDKATGVIEESFGAKDAPAHFPERTIEGAVAQYVDLREEWTWQMDPVIDHKIKLMSAKAEQKRYQDERAKDPPGKRYGMEGYARVTNIDRVTRTGVGRDHTYAYDVHFTRTSLLAANMTKPVVEHLTAHVQFQFHPEIAMPSKQDRLDNESGLYVLYYNVSNY